ncbi:MAG: pyruvate kinase, partial [Ruthenibacterium sp.]
MLESMMENPRPTRAEITDVANAIYDGTSAIMLSGETAAGRYPVESVKTMNAIALRTESDINYDKRLKSRANEGHLSVAGAVAHAACTTAMDIKADAIITVSKSGETARLLCKYRPETVIIACVLTEQICRQLSLSWGIIPIMMEYAHDTDALIEQSVSAAKAVGLVNDGDLVVITAGVPVGISGTTNMIKAHLVGDALLTGVGIGKTNTMGYTCVCRTAEDVKTKAKHGCVLVVPSTNNEMLEAIRDAVAVIAEESGNNSHAAIVGLSLGKPVIVGAIGATRKLHDGMKVSVDGERGIVHAMPE